MYLFPSRSLSRSLFASVSAQNGCHIQSVSQSVTKSMSQSVRHIHTYMHIHTKGPGKRPTMRQIDRVSREKRGKAGVKTKEDACQEGTFFKAPG